MPVDRPTFSESWYRVSELRPRLRATTQMHRQHFRGEMYHVIHDPSNNQFFQLPDAAYEFVALLDGKHTVGEIWKICNDKLGDNAPTQGEAIRLLGQLYTSNLIHAEMPPDAESLFTRFRRRKVRETQSFLMNLLFLRIPILDPDRFLDRWVGLFGRLFTTYSFVAWVLLIGAGLFAISGHFDKLVDAAKGGNGVEGILAPSKLPLLYISMFLLKVLHEFGHAFACKRLGRREGSTGEVHEMGVMFMVLMPMAYVDASISWSFRSKWRRILVGAAGMIVELAVAAVAAIVWANTTPGTLNSICYNIIFIAGVSTVLFNGNPLLRYDGYYMLSDLLEIPNLAQRSRQYLYYLVKKYAWGVRQAQDPAHTHGERGWFVVYGIASTIYRVFVSIAILLFVSDQLFILGAILAIAAIVTWVLVPLGKLLRYLFTSPELTRQRGRALLTTGAALALLVGGLGVLPVSDHYRAEGVVEAADYAIIRAGGDGFILEVLPTSAAVTPQGPFVIKAENLELQSQLKELQADKLRLEAEKRLRETKEVQEGLIIADQIATVEKQIARVQKMIDDLNVLSPVAGTWVCPQYHRLRNMYLRRGDPIGQVASLDKLIIRATADQDAAALLFQEARPQADVRGKSAPGVAVTATIQKIHPAGKEDLPSPAMSFAAGGEHITSTEDRSGTQSVERLFEVELTPNAASALRPGQRVVVRFEMSPKPLVAQAWQSLLQTIQKRFHI